MLTHREKKKAATKTALATAAAEIALSEGIAAATVAKICQTAHVSVRTFHNYFSSRDEALHFFSTEAIDEFCQIIVTTSPGADLLATIEQVTLQVLHQDAQRSQSLRGIIALTGPNFSPTGIDLNRLSASVVSSYHRLHPELTTNTIEWVVIVTAQALAGSLVRFFHGSANDTIGRTPEECVTNCMRVLRHGFQLPESKS
ncbi:TetR family transcriptional regulator [Corynebacterium hindlerae]|uniref:TetR family transcriptional regulator n=1 Tax=Corynebacterium hindlerae TaxID=699041 RepID=A0A7G5FGL8_9CORY|nr:TetR family transcriptional regulator [Corynebacterium hindlerae]QMV85759.1 TetR family transcriptional regulator [Corynebacterium hindlerae]